ncbi:hypothetical protein EK21DRAFT_77371 [Setomelanomma holmii]|uniref:Uncharacterized protein n=1 Tax=Setomelanomma holmii TaxID=210430 RepID=A0A9P4H1M9_9PLEO|nr:hypothetical protein EK21DRAFT_77371 [Setomelanomma holmii]
MRHFLAVFTILSISLALPSPQSPGTLVILDNGVGHRSTPVPRWRTSLRSISTRGTNATVLEEFGPTPSPRSVVGPINAYGLAHSPSTQSLFLATGESIVRTALNGSNSRVIVDNVPDVHSVAVADSQQKIYWGTTFDGFIRRANYDGSGIEVFRNVSQGINWDLAQYFEYANSYADGILVDEDNGWVYWSASRGPDDGSIRRVRLDDVRSGCSDEADAKKEVALAKGLDMPGQLKIRDGWLYWIEMGRWSTSPTSMSKARLPATASSGLLTPEIMVHSNASSIFIEQDYTGERQILNIQSFVFSEVAEKLWFVI